MNVIRDIFLAFQLIYGIKCEQVLCWRREAIFACFRPKNQYFKTSKKIMNSLLDITTLEVFYGNLREKLLISLVSLKINLLSLISSYLFKKNYKIMLVYKKSYSFKAKKEIFGLWKHLRFSSQKELEQKRKRKKLLWKPDLSLNFGFLEEMFLSFSSFIQWKKNEMKKFFGEPQTNEMNESFMQLSTFAKNLREGEL